MKAPDLAIQSVGVAGFEPTASSSRTKRATKLRHTPREATTAYRTSPAPRQSALSRQPLLAAAVGDLRHSPAWNNRDVGAIQ